MKAIVSVFARDAKGITAYITAALAEQKPFVPLGLVVPPTSKLLSDSAAPRSTLTKASCPSASAATMEGSSLHFSTARPSESVDASAKVWFCLS